MEKYVQIEIDTKGQAKIEAVGFKGAGCKEATANFEKLYEETVSAQDKPELYEGVACQIPQIKAR